VRNKERNVMVRNFGIEHQYFREKLLTNNRGIVLVLVYDLPPKRYRREKPVDLDLSPKLFACAFNTTTFGGRHSKKRGSKQRCIPKKEEISRGAC